MKKIIAISLIASSVLFFGGCTTTQKTYGYADVNRAKVVKHGEIVSTRQIEFDGNQGVGTVAGAAAGGVAGYQFGKGKGQVAASVIGALLGAAAGNAMSSNKPGLEILVRQNDGTEIMVTTDQMDFRVGDYVQVIYEGRNVEIRHAPRDYRR
ncbi:MAG: glycine zipper 2TM domain-containing protein [Campylobacterales bacterium]|nr:glycine zipper 2TM domain-containing protein [Campylobacterales bacterium]